MSLFVIAMRKRRAFALEIIEMLNLEDIRDELSSEQNVMVQLFHRQLQELEQDGLKNGFEMFDKLCGIAGLSSQAKGYALAYRGDCHRWERQWEKALSDFGQALRYIPEDALVITSRGVAYRSMGHYEEALADLDHAITLDEKLAWAINNRGVTYFEMGRYHDALAELNRSITLNEKARWSFANRGSVYRQMGHYQEALADFDKAIDLDAKFAAAFDSRGLTYLYMDRYEEALADFDRAIALDEKDAWAIGRRGYTYYQMGRYQEALADFDRAFDLDDRNDWYWYCRALIHLLTDNASAFESDIDTAIKKAQSTLNKASTTEYWRIGFNLALYNLVAGNLVDAESQYTTLVSTCSSLTNLQGAVEDLTDLLKMQPSNERAQGILTQLHTRIAELQRSLST